MKIIRCLFLFLLLSFKLNFAQQVELQYLANEGIYLKSQDKAILIDAIFEKEFDYLDVLNDEELDKFSSHKAPYKSIDLILATHLHGDHFNGKLIGKHMLINSNSNFLGPEEVVKNFKLNFNDFNKINQRVKSITPELFKTEIIKIKGITIEIFRTEHFGTKPWSDAENLVYLIHVDDVKVLHFGDGKISLKNLEQLNLKDKAIDVAILPYWQLGSENQRSLIENYINPDQILVAHIPLANQQNAQNQIDALGYKNAIALTKQFKVIKL